MSLSAPSLVMDHTVKPSSAAPLGATREDAAALPRELAQLERALRTRLDGCRLVYEADFNEAVRPALTEALRRAIESLGSRARSELPRQYPALTVVAIVLDAVFAYDGGELWPNLAVPDRTPPMLGPAFSAAISKLGLEQFPSFDEQNAQRHVARVLAHGGIPHRSLPKYFQFLDETLTEADADAASCLELIRYSPRYRTAIPQPVRRFLSETGAVGVDLLTRTIELLEETDSTGDVSEHARGLPRHLVSCFKDHRASSQGRTATERLGLRPLLRYEGEHGEGPFLLLPAVPQRVPEHCTWHITFDGTVEGSADASARRAARRDVATEIDVPPAALWRLELRDPTGETLFSRTIPGLRDQDVLVFSAGDGELIRDARFSPELVHVLSRCELYVQGPEVRIVRPLPVPDAASWNGWRGYEVAVSGSGALIGTFLGESVRVSLGLQVQRPLVLEDGIARVLTEDGLPVHSTVPSIISLPWTSDSDATAWTVQARVNGSLHSLAGRSPLRMRPELERLIVDDRISDVRLTCRASLGESTTSRFMVVPGLVCVVPPELITPVDPPFRCSASVSPGLRLTDESGNVLDRVDLGCSDPVPPVIAMDDHGSRVVIRLAPNLLRWRVVRDKDLQSPLVSRRLHIGLGESGELERMQLQLLAADTASIPELALRRGQRVLAQVPLEPTRRMQGGYRADLGVLRAPIEHEAGTSFELCLLLGSRAVVLAVLQDVTAITLSAGAFEYTADRVHFVGALECAKPLRGRLLRFTCVDRPWRAPFEMAVADDPPDACRIDVTGLIGRGRYSLTVGIEDGAGGAIWYQAGRPLVLAVRTGPSFPSGSFDGRDLVLDAIADGIAPVIPQEMQQRAAEAVGLILSGERLSMEEEAVVGPLIRELDADWHRVLAELHSRLGATPPALLRVCIRLIRIAPQTLQRTAFPIAPTVAPPAALFWLVSQTSLIRRELAGTFLAELGVRGVLQPDDLIGGEPRKPSPQQVADYDELCRTTLAPLGANGRARAVFSTLMFAGGRELIPAWTEKFRALLDLSVVDDLPAPLRILTERLRSGRRSLEPGMRLRPFHLTTMAAALHLWIGSPRARQAEECLVALSNHVANYCACRIAGVGALVLLGEA